MEAGKEREIFKSSEEFQKVKLLVEYQVTQWEVKSGKKNVRPPISEPEYRDLITTVFSMRAEKETALLAVDYFFTVNMLWDEYAKQRADYQAAVYYTEALYQNLVHVKHATDVFRIARELERRSRKEERTEPAVGELRKALHEFEIHDLEKNESFSGFIKRAGKEIKVKFLKIRAYNRLTSIAAEALDCAAIAKVRYDTDFIINRAQEYSKTRKELRKSMLKEDLPEAEKKENASALYRIFPSLASIVGKPPTAEQVEATTSALLEMRPYSQHEALGPVLKILER